MSPQTESRFPLIENYTTIAIEPVTGFDVKAICVSNVATSIRWLLELKKLENRI